MGEAIISRNGSSGGNSGVGLKTSTGGEIFNDYEGNKILEGKFGNASGSNNQIGYYGYRLKYDSGMGLAINTRMMFTVLDNDLAEKAYQYYEVGDIIQLDLLNHFYDRYKITDITPGDEEGTYTRITFGPINEAYMQTDYLTMVSDEDNADGLHNWMYVIGKPYGEPTKHSYGASVRGGSNIAIGLQSDVSGRNNIGIGDLSSITGRDNKAGYAASAGGYYCEAMPSYSDVKGYHLKASRNQQTVRGKFNAEDPDALFVIGNGTNDTTRNNAFVVNEDGTAELQSSLFSNGVNISNKLDESTCIQVSELPVSGDLSKIYLLKDSSGFYSKYIFTLNDDNTSDEDIEIWDGSTRTEPVYNEADGVYDITNGAELAYIIYNGGGEGNIYRLTNDIYLNDISKINWQTGSVDSDYTVHKWFQNWNWNPMAATYVSTSFEGTIDGNNHIIHGLYTKSSSTTYATSDLYGCALIPRSTGSVTIKNLGIDNSYIHSQYCAAVFIAISSDTETQYVNIDNCYIGENVSLDGYRAIVFRGIIKNSSCHTTITNSYSLATINHNENGYGLVYSIWGSLYIHNCYNAKGPITSNSEAFGVDTQQCYQSDDAGYDRAGVTTIPSENFLGSDVFTNLDKMPSLNTSPPHYITSDDYPKLISFNCAWVCIENVSKEYVDDIIKYGDAKDISPYCELIDIDNDDGTAIATIIQSESLLNEPLSVWYCPSSINGYTITRVDGIQGLNNISGFIYPDSMTIISDRMIYANTNLKWIELPAITQISGAGLLYSNDTIDIYYKGTPAQWLELCDAHTNNGLDTRNFKFKPIYTNMNINHELESGDCNAISALALSKSLSNQITKTGYTVVVEPGWDQKVYCYMGSDDSSIIINDLSILATYNDGTTEVFDNYIASGCIAVDVKSPYTTLTVNSDNLSTFLTCTYYDSFNIESIKNKLETLDSNISEYKYEKGSNGIWTYEKRSDGTYICYGTLHVESLSFSEEKHGSIMYVASIYYMDNPLPENLFTKINHVQVSSTTGLGYYANAQPANISTYGIGVNIYSPDQQSYTGDIYIYIIGE